MAPVLLLLLLSLLGKCDAKYNNVVTTATKKATVTDIARASDVQISLDETTAICKIDRRFVSVTFSIGSFNKSDHAINTNPKRVRKLLKALSPMYVRVGGSKANFLMFEDPESNQPESILLESRAYVPQPTEEDIHRLAARKYKRSLLIPEEQEESDEEREQRKQKKLNFRDFKMNASTFDSIYNVITNSGNKMVFDVNAFPQVPKGVPGDSPPIWDASNAKELFQYAKDKDYNIDWQLGNEPNHYKNFGGKHQRSGGDVASAYTLFKSILMTSNLGKSKVIGPEVTRPKKNGNVRLFVRDFLEKASSTIDAFGWHQYYIDGREATENDFLDPAVLDRFDTQSTLMREILNENNFTKPVWITETGSAWGGGAKELSNRFAGLFPYVDKLGVASKHCVQVVCRQAFLSGKYAMVDKKTLQPNPDYYAAVLFKRLADETVVRLTVSGKPDKRFRVYARCARETRNTLSGSVFVYILNLHNREKSFSFPDYELFKVKQYLFTAAALNSDVLKLNGKPLSVTSQKLPKMRPTLVDQPVKIPGQSIGYYVLDGITLGVC